MNVYIKEAHDLIGFILMCVCGQILSSTFVTSNGHLGQRLDSLKTVVVHHGQYDDERAPPPPLPNHCNHHSQIGGQEGQVHIGYILTQVTIVMTPGETSFLDSKGQGHFSCNIQPDFHTTNKISSFQETANVYRMVQSERHGFKEFHPDFNIHCTSNHLTDSGFKQVIAIGEHLNTSYFSKLFHGESRLKSSKVHVESIPEQQCYHSVLGLLHGLLTEKEFVKVKVKKSFDRFCDTFESDLTSCRCDYLNEFKPYISQALTEGKFMFKSSIPDIDRLRQLFGAYSEYGLTAVQLIKLFRQARCNGLSSVCDRLGQCYNVTEEAEKELEDMTSKYQQKLFSSPEIRHYFHSAIYPFLQRLVHRMSGEDSQLRIHIGTEEFLQQLRTSMNVLQDGPLPVASRLVFEIYQRAPDQLDSGQLYVRVLMDGGDVTRQVDGCHGNLENGLCPVSRFLKLVTALQQQYKQKC